MAKEIVFTINEQTGALEMVVNGVKGKACAPIAAMVEEFFGQAPVHQNTAEFTQTEVKPQTQIRRG